MNTLQVNLSHKLVWLHECKRRLHICEHSTENITLVIRKEPHRPSQIVTILTFTLNFLSFLTSQFSFTAPPRAGTRSNNYSTPAHCCCRDGLTIQHAPSRRRNRRQLASASLPRAPHKHKFESKGANLRKQKRKRNNRNRREPTCSYLAKSSQQGLSRNRCSDAQLKFPHDPRRFNRRETYPNPYALALRLRPCFPYLIFPEEPLKNSFFTPSASS